MLSSSAIDSRMSSHDPTDLLRWRSSFPSFGVVLPSPVWTGAISETACGAMSACAGLSVAAGNATIADGLEEDDVDDDDNNDDDDDDCENRDDEMVTTMMTSITTQWR